MHTVKMIIIITKEDSSMHNDCLWFVFGPSLWSEELEAALAGGCPSAILHGCLLGLHLWASDVEQSHPKLKPQFQGLVKLIHSVDGYCNAECAASGVNWSLAYETGSPASQPRSCVADEDGGFRQSP